MDTKAPSSFCGRTILLVDDVLDNGKMLEEAVKACESTGAKGS